MSAPEAVYAGGGGGVCAGVRDALAPRRPARGARRARALRGVARRLDREHGGQLGRVCAARPRRAHGAHRDSRDRRQAGPRGNAAAPARLGLHGRDRDRALGPLALAGPHALLPVRPLRDAARAAARAAAAASRRALRRRAARARPRLPRMVAPGPHRPARARRRRLGRDAAAGLAAACAARAGGRDPVRRRLPGLAEAALSGGARGAARRGPRLARARSAPGTRGAARDALPGRLRPRLRGLPRRAGGRLRRAHRAIPLSA